MALTDAEKTLNDTLDKKFDRLIKAIKEVGFPIVLSGFLIAIFYEWGGRLVASQEKFVENVTKEIETQTDEIKAQTNNTNRILIAQEAETIHEANQSRLMERQLQLLEKKLEESKEK